MRVRMSLGGLPSMESFAVAVRLEPDLDVSLARFEETHARAAVALRFLLYQDSSAEHLRVPVDEERQMQAGLLRAALMEYVGMEDCLPGDLRRMGLPGPALRITDTGSAMLVLLRELRHVHVHVGQTHFSRREQTAIFRIPDREAMEITMPVLTIPRADLEQLHDPRHSKRFYSGELAAAIDWLDAAQSHWGIRHVVQAAINDYGRRIVAAHGAG
jgi:hypothetical protein